MTEKPWGGRFSEKTNKLVEKFTSSINIDRRLYIHDIEGSIAHCRMLAKVGIITEDEGAAMIDGLAAVKREIERDQFTFDDTLEDIHMHIESRLVQIIGKTAGKLHTARSRNDQVALDIRMYLREETRTVIAMIDELRRTIIAFAKTHLDVILPGYTHLQKAQPVLLSHHFMAYYEMFSRDAERFGDGYQRINVMPLGSAALAGTTYPIDRQYTAELLAFSQVSRNSIDSVSDRDFIIEFLSSASICMMHFSRLSEEMILWSTSEFNFIEFPDAFSTGSSIMPQKKNPDVAELVRGKTGRVFGDLTAMLTTMKSLPLSYNRDMQEDKEPLFDALDTLKACIEIYINMIPRLIVKSENMRQSAQTGFLNATDMADYLVVKGMPFRDAHSCVGKAVSYAIANQKELHNLTVVELQSFSKLIDSDLFENLTPEAMINRRAVIGGTALKYVQQAVEAAEKELA